MEEFYLFDHYLVFRFSWTVKNLHCKVQNVLQALDKANEQEAVELSKITGPQYTFSKPTKFRNLQLHQHSHTNNNTEKEAVVKWNLLFYPAGNAVLETNGGRSSSVFLAGMCFFIFN